jgi:ATP synthase protein I
MATDPKDSLEERKRQLEARLAQAQADDDGKGRAADDGRKGYSQALKLSSEFVAAVIVGAMIGYLLDLTPLHTKPWGLIVFLLLGFCAGVLNVLRAAGKVSSPHPVDRIGEHRERNKER